MSEYFSKFINFSSFARFEKSRYDYAFGRASTLAWRCLGFPAQSIQCWRHWTLELTWVYLEFRLNHFPSIGTMWFSRALLSRESMAVKCSKLGTRCNSVCRSHVRRQSFTKSGLISIYISLSLYIYIILYQYSGKPSLLTGYLTLFDLVLDQASS